MRICLKCGKNIRDGADFCTACGAPAPAAAPNQGAGNAGPQPRSTGGASSVPVTTDVPLITLAPERNPMSKQRLLRTGKLMLGVTAIILVAIVGVFAAAFLRTEPFKENPLEETTLNNQSYRDCLALVGDVRNDNFDVLIKDIIQMTGDFKDYNFLTAYEGLFKEIVPDDSSDELAIMFRDCCFMVAYTEFTAKKYEDYASSGILASLYIDDADRYRKHADTLWEKLNNAQTEEHFQIIIDYCEENDIIYRKDPKPQSSTVSAADAQ